MLRLVTEDWTTVLHDRLRKEATSPCEDAQPHVQMFDEPPARPSDGLLFGSYGTSPISGLHFEAADDTAAS